ncbi:MAG: primosomal protein N', partial [Clostridia bacterium]|nr:primosomal protein N' [Clostridia bacterium]
DGRNVIVMVPEISLTPQMVSLFRGRYKNEVAVFHSALSMGERKDEYRRVRNGGVRIVVGTRSAVFAPLQNIGLIVIDEEQEHTYKSEASPRYHARDVARFRAKKHSALLLLSSATPGIESYSLAKKGIYSLEKLTERYGEAVLPEVTVIDMKAEKSRGNKYLISTELQNRLKSNLEAKKQSILLMNRRGYNTFVACDSCGSVVTCPYCSISMTFHLSNKKLMCHYCGYTTDFKTKCDVCGKENVRYSGYGTQRIEEELHNLLPEARILRMDTDSNSGRYAFEKNITAFGKNEYDIMLGTQMVAKGLDFENVTLVGVINADQQLNNDDFRSEELTFDLLTQVVGRCGRGKSKGTAVIQTMTPENNIIALAKRQDYEEFYKTEIAIRRMMTYPPFCDICAVYAVSEDELKALSAARVFLDEFKKRTENAENVPKVIVLPVMPPRIAKVNNKFRYRIIIKCKNTAAFRRIISDLLVEFGASRTFGDVTVFADINPLSLV